jgi:ubiquitin carboxyl-terminal hydrolase 8
MEQSSNYNTEDHQHNIDNDISSNDSADLDLREVIKSKNSIESPNIGLIDDDERMKRMEHYYQMQRRQELERYNRDNFMCDDSLFREKSKVDDSDPLRRLEHIRKMEEMHQNQIKPQIMTHNVRPSYKKNFKELKNEQLPNGIIRLNNLGCTCYMNSILQCLFNTVTFKDDITSDNFPYKLLPNVVKDLDIANEQNYSKILEKVQLTVAFQMYKIMQSCWNNNIKQIKPTSFMNIFSHKIVNFRSFRQQDSQEALLCILDSMHVELQKSVNIKYDFCEKEYLDLFKIAEEKKISDIDCCAMESSCPNFWELLSFKRAIDRDILKNYSVVSKTFQLMICSSLQCPDCKFHTFTFDSPLMLTLLIPNERTIDLIAIGEQMKHFENADVKKQEQIKQQLILNQCQNHKFTLDDCLKNFIRNESLDDNNKWQCEYCKKKVNASKRLNIWVPPKILIIHIKRFIHDMTDGKYSAMKLNNTIEYPIYNFNINPYMSKYPSKKGNYSYDLYGVSNHIGSLNGGHCFSFVKSFDDGKWYCLDDDTISLIENENDVISQDAYILFYKLRS